jgi:hypothetical protein
MYRHLELETQGEVRPDAIGHNATLTIAVLDFTLLINRLIRKARRYRVITQQEAEYLGSMAEGGPPAESTRDLLCRKGAPDFPYAALHFSTFIWQAAEAAEDDAQARAGFMLAQFVLSEESPERDSFWATKLLRELYDAHAESAQPLVEFAAGGATQSLEVKGY